MKEISKILGLALSGWFLLYIVVLIALHILAREEGYKPELSKESRILSGYAVIFITLVALWFRWALS